MAGSGGEDLGQIVRDLGIRPKFKKSVKKIGNYYSHRLTVTQTRSRQVRVEMYRIYIGRPLMKMKNDV
jgi:hypothetical protein